mgnify:CR=1 FL=1
MPVTSSGIISLAGDIVGEFGGTAPHALSEYYRNGGLVTAGNTNVPTSGSLAFSDFYGSTAIANRDIRVQMSYAGGHSYSAFGVTSANSTAAPQSYSGSLLYNAFTIYSPVFRAGAGYLGQNLSFNFGQNENAQPTSLTLFGGTSGSAVNDVVFAWSGGYSNSSGGNKSYSLVYNSDGSIASLTQTGAQYNSGIISLNTQNINSNHRWYMWRMTSPRTAAPSSRSCRRAPTRATSPTRLVRRVPHPVLIGHAASLNPY